MSKMRRSAKSGKVTRQDPVAAQITSFNVDDPVLPPEIRAAALASGGYPYDGCLPAKAYEKDLRALQIELLKLQAWAREAGERIVIAFEGRDAAGKGGVIKRFMQHLNPRHARAVALSQPTETERGQWYFQRYITHFPTAGDIVLFERSWYNRAGVERVMGFCSTEEAQKFLREAPEFESALARDGLRLFKFWMSIGREMQLKRFHDRRHDPLKTWKLSDVDLSAIGKWDAYTSAKEEMFQYTHTPGTPPWTVVRANDKRRARLNAMRAVLCEIDYEGKDKEVVGKPDPLIVGSGPDFFYTA